MDAPVPGRRGRAGVLGLAPFFHSMGLQLRAPPRARRAARAIVALARFDLEGTLRAMQEHGVDQALVAPPLLAALAHHPIVDVASTSPSLRTARERRRARWTPGSSSAAAERLRRASSAPGYGITEAGPLVAVCPSFARAARRSGSVGMLVGGTRPGRRPAADGAGGGRRGLAARAAAVLRLPRRRRTPRPSRSTPTAGCTPATSAHVDADGLRDRSPAAARS